MQKHVNLVDLVKSFPTNIYLQNLASIQKRTSPVKFAHLAEKSGKGSISNLSTKAAAPCWAVSDFRRVGVPRAHRTLRPHRRAGDAHDGHALELPDERPRRARRSGGVSSSKG